MYTGQVSSHDMTKVYVFSIQFFSYSTIQGRIDQVNQVLQLDKENSTGSRYNAIDKWSNQIQSLQMAVINKMA